MPSDDTGRDLRDYLAVLKRRRWIVISATVLVAGTALLLSFLQTPIYQGRARVLLLPGGSLFDSSFSQSVGQSEIQTEMQVLQSQPVLEAVRQKLGGALPRTSVVAVGQTSVIEVRAESTGAGRAATVANAYADAYIDYSRKQNVSGLLSASEEIQRKIDEVQKQVDRLSERLAALPPCTGNNPPPECTERSQVQEDRDAQVSQLVPLKQRLNQLQVDASFNKGGPRLITPASVPTSPIRPTPKRNGVLGLGVGLLFGTALAFAFEHFDDSIKSKEDLERAARDVTVLGLIPMVAGWKNREETYVVSRAEPSSPAAEAYRTLRTSIHFLGIDRSLRVLQVTSPNASEGKTTAVANLAVVLARAGERVVVLSCDLRRPRIHEFFGLPNTVGFTSVLLGKADLASVLQPVPGEERLSLLATGPLPPNPSELLASEKTGALVQALKERADIILIDSPPVLPVTDAAVLSARADGVLLVATVGSTSGKHVARAVELLRQVGAPLTGAVLNGVSGEGSYGYAYDYYVREESGNGRGAGKQRSQPANP
jgi:non-specific protein-tyrosine kinase